MAISRAHLVDPAVARWFQSLMAQRDRAAT